MMNPCRLVHLTRAADLAAAYSQIAEDLQMQTMLAYNPTHHGCDGNWHEIRVEVKSRPEATVRTRKGYYAQNK